MEDKSVVLTPLIALSGATISGDDLSDPLDYAAFRRLHVAWPEHNVSFFRDRGSMDS
jgi:alpha-ketoglutarate-dependent taurine dioxygenase